MEAPKELPSRVHGQRISRPELVLESRAYLERAGVANNLRAEFISHVARLVVKNPNPLFAQHQPATAESQLTALYWADAYDLVARFLSDNKLAFTRGTADTELPAFVGRLGYSTSGPSSEPHQLQDLVSSSDGGKDFPERVTKHAKKAKAKKAPPPPAADADQEAPVKSSPAKASPKKKSSPRKIRKRKSPVRETDEKPSPVRKAKARGAKKSPTRKAPPPEEQLESSASSASFHDEDE
jgi:hypothetical protein